MTVGTVSTKVLTDIANAVRQQNGSDILYTPAQLPAAVAALDGTKAGDGRAEPYMELERGVLSDKVFAKLGDAIRKQNGLDTRYRPDEMAAAILALEWGGGLKPRALLLDDGTLELNYLDRKRSSLGRPIVRSWDVAPEGYQSPEQCPWNDSRDDISHVTFDASWRDSGVTSYARWFSSCASLVDVAGFENLVGQVALGYMFASCVKLETVYAAGFDNADVAGCFGMFSGCRSLVGGEGYVPSLNDGKKMLSTGPAGALTDPANDLREWTWCHLYADGELAIGGESDGREEVLSGRICLTAAYRATNSRPWYNDLDKVLKVTLLPGVATNGKSNLNYWFHGCDGCSEVTGLGNLSHVNEMDQTFNSCSSLESLDFRGFDPADLTSLVYTFANCTSLKTITADKSWVLPDSVSGAGTFLGCESLIGGSGTAYSASNTNSCWWFCIDQGDADRGYLTAG